MTSTAWARVETDWTLHGQPALVLTNDRLRVVVLPGLGGRVWEVLDLRSGRQLLWHHPRLAPAPVPFGTSYDDNFIGGWDELFPNDLAEELAGEPYPDHGEAWSVPWQWQVEPGPDAVVRLTLTTRISACRLERVLRLAPASDTLVLETSATNGTGAELPMLHKQHCAVDLPAGSRIDLPPARVEIGEFGRLRAGDYGERFGWPMLGETDFAAAPRADGEVSELLFATDLTDGWCAVTRPDGLGLTMTFDRAAYPACWTFASWGGWRGLRVAVLEPCTGSGVSVAEGLAAGRHRTLAAGETLSTRLGLTVHRDLAQVTAVVHHDGRTTVQGVPLVTGGER